MAPSERRVFVDHYALLGAPAEANAEEIKSAFRRQARLSHPDVTHDDGLRFLEVHTAYRILSDPALRAEYDRQYLAQRALRTLAESTLKIPRTRLVFPVGMAGLAKRGLLRRKYRSRDRLFYLKVDYDVELRLKPAELLLPLEVEIPQIVRALCPDCRGSNPDCAACNGRGYYKSSRSISLHLTGGLVSGQIIEINLAGLKPGPLSHFKRRTLRLKISVVQAPEGGDRGAL